MYVHTVHNYSPIMCSAKDERNNATVMSEKTNTISTYVWNVYGQNVHYKIIVDAT